MMRATAAYENMEMEAPALSRETERLGPRARAVLIAVPLALAGAYATILLLV